MKRISIISLKQLNGNVIFDSENPFEFGGIPKKDISFYYFDDSFFPGEVVEEILESQPDTFIVVCGQGTVRYASRIILSIYKEKKQEIQYFICTEELECNQILQLYDIKIHVIHSLNELQNNEHTGVIKKVRYCDLPVLYDDTYKIALKNGYIAFITGEYPYGMIKGCNKHIGFDTFAEFEKNADNIKMNLNSSVILQAEEYRTETFEKALQVADIWSHYIFTDKKGTLIFDDSDIEVETERKTMEEFILNDPIDNEETMNIVTVSSKNDYLAFGRILKQYYECGKILNANYYIVDECRFINYCMAKKLYRGRIKDGNLYTCNNMHRCAGRMEEEKNKKIAALNYYETGTLPACLMMPEEEKLFYQELSDLFPDIREYILKRNLLLFLKNNSNIIAKAKNVKISNKRYSVLYDGPTGNVKKNMIVNILYADGMFYFYDERKASLVKLDHKLVLIIEGYIKGAEDEDIAAALARFCSVNNSTAVALLEQGKKLLRAII